MRFWSIEEDVQLIDWYESGVTNLDLNLTELARLLGRPKTGVCRRARELGLTKLNRAKTGQCKQVTKKFSSDGERNKATGERIREYIKDNGHPKGSLGLKHTRESREKMSSSIKAAWNRKDSKYHTESLKQQRSDLLTKRHKEMTVTTNPFSRARDGRRADLDNRYFRSAWEANYARYLNFLKSRKEILDWDYECQTFWFTNIKRGVRSYKPDFKVLSFDGSHEWHEVKGWMTSKAATAIKRFKKYYPAEKHIVIGAAWFKQAKKSGLEGVIPNWE